MSGRIADPALAAFVAVKDEVVVETAEAMHELDKAHVVVLLEAGAIDHEVGAVLLNELIRIEEGGAVAARHAAGGGDHAGERLLTHRLGPEIGGMLGLARSSGDLAAANIRFLMRAGVQDLTAALQDARRACVNFALSHVETVMVGYTHAQHAQPTTLAHWALMYERAFARDEERLEALFSRVNRSPLGAGIMSGTDVPISRERMASLLGFGEIDANTMDAVLSHDVELEFGSVLLLASQTLARLADDLILWSTFEFGMIELPDNFCGTSSLMPQKKNPVGLETFKTTAHAALGVLVTAISTERGPTGLPIIERKASRRATRDILRDLAAQLSLLPLLLLALKVDYDRMDEIAGANWSTASDLAALIVREQGLAWRTAHKLVGQLIRRCAETGKSPSDVGTADLDTVAAELGYKLPPLSEDHVQESLRPRRFISRRDLPGAPAPARIAASIHAAQADINAATCRRDAREKMLTEARSGLAQAVASVTQLTSSRSA